VSTAAKIRHCKACGAAGHRSDSERCPNHRAPEPTLAIVPVPPLVVAVASHAPDRIAQVAVLREARDAIAADIVRLENVRATVEERLAEAYEHRAKLDIRIRELRGGTS
jgi:hypothetical protein